MFRVEDFQSLGSLGLRASGLFRVQRVQGL